MPTCAIYVRVSTDDQTVENQFPALEALAATRKLQVTRRFEDVISGTKFKRPGFDALMAAARRGEFQYILVWAVDRLGRSMPKIIETVVEFDRLGISLVSYSEGWLDTSGPTRSLLLSIFAWVAEQERTRLIDRTNAGLDRARAAGKTLGRPKVALDLDEVLRLRKKGLSISMVARTLRVGVGTVHRALQSADVPASCNGG